MSWKQQIRVKPDLVHKSNLYKIRHIFTNIYINPVLKSSMLEFWKVQHFFVRHFVPRSIVRKGVLPKNCSLLWDWTPSHAQRIYKGQNSENPLRAITFDWSDLRTWFQRLWATFLMLISGIPHLPTFRHVACVTSCHITCVTCVTYLTCQVSRKVGKWGIPEKSIKNVAQRRWNQVRRSLQSKVMARNGFSEFCPL